MDKIRRTNFYLKSEACNKEQVEVYLGQSAGRQLTLDILNAKKEVLIISPYIDETKLDELITLKNKGINVRLAFSDLREEQKKTILRKLIHQQKDVNERLREEVLKKKNLFFILSVTALVIAISLFLFLSLNLGSIQYKNIIYLVFSFISFIIFYKLNKKKQEVERTTIYKYDYFEKINFKYLRNDFRSKNKMFIHSKIYIIDRKIAYLGSLNFTNNGFSSNFETRIRITNSEKIKELVEFVHSIFDDNESFNSHELSFLGRQVYSEEKY